MLGGQILLPSNNSKASRRSHRSTSSSSSSKSSKASKVQGDFASGGSGMVPSEPQSSAHSEVETKRSIFEAFFHILANTVLQLEMGHLLILLWENWGRTNLQILRKHKKTAFFVLWKLRYWYTQPHFKITFSSFPKTTFPENLWPPI